MCLKPSDILNLPDAPDFISRPPAFTATQMARLCEEMLPYWNKIRIAPPPPPFVGERFRIIDEPDNAQER